MPEPERKYGLIDIYAPQPLYVTRECAFTWKKGEAARLTLPEAEELMNSLSKERSGIMYGVVNLDQMS